MAKATLTWDEPPVSRLRVKGAIDEDVAFEPWVARFAEEAIIDFSGVTRINSCGVRQWTKAVLTSRTLLRYVDAPSLIVDQFSMVPEFLGPRGRVESFQARYVCVSCGAEETVNLVVGVDVSPGPSPAPPERSCLRCGSQSEFDHNPDVYLAFLAAPPTP